jgi:hypothetical protein
VNAPGARDGLPGEADETPSRRSLADRVAIRPELTCDRLVYDNNPRLRGAFRLSETAAARDVDAEHVEVFRRHGQHTDGHSR